MISHLSLLSFRRVVSLWVFLSELLLVHYGGYNSFFVYVSHENELCTHVFIQKLLSLWKSVYIPWRDRFSMQASHLYSWVELLPWCHGILRQQSPIPYDGKIDLVVVPWLAFDEKGVRLGRGWWYYDQRLMKHAWSFGCALWVCYDFQLLTSVPCCAHDVAMRRVLSIGF